jgi:hypothetical protein
MEFNIVQLERALPSGLVTAIHWTASQTTDGTTSANLWKNDTSVTILLHQK